LLLITSRYTCDVCYDGLLGNAFSHPQY